MRNLIQDEQASFEYIKNKINSHIEEDAVEAINYLDNLPYDMLQNFCDYSRQVKIFLDDNLKIYAVLAKRLEEANYLSISVISMDRKEKNTLFDHYLAMLHMQIYYEVLSHARSSSEARNTCFKALDKACELGLYNALIVRCQHNSSAFKTSLRKEKKEDAIKLIMKDTDRLINLYWSIGYIQSGSLWQVLDDYLFLNKKEQTQVYNPAFHEKAVKNFLCASLLANHIESARVMDALTHGQGLAWISYEKDVNPQTWDEFQEMVRDWVDGNTYEKLLSCAQQEIAAINIKEEAEDVVWKKAA